MTSTGRGRAGRRWRLPLLVCLSIAAALIAALPWMLRLADRTRRLAAAANAILAPSSVEYGSIRLSWFQPTLIENVVLRDAQGDPVLTAPRAVFQWNLWQILVARPSHVTLTIERGDLDIERFADGTVDLLETLKPVIAEHPRTRLVIRVVHGRLRFRDPAFPEPVIADHADIMLDLSRDSEPITWRFRLNWRQRQGTARRVLRTTGSDPFWQTPERRRVLRTTGSDPFSRPARDRGKLQPRFGGACGAKRPDAVIEGSAVAVDTGELGHPVARKPQWEYRWRPAIGPLAVGRRCDDHRPGCDRRTDWIGHDSSGYGARELEPGRQRWRVDD